MYSFPNFEPVYCSMFISDCCFLTCIQISQEAGMFTLDLEKAEEPEIKLLTSIGSLKKQESSRKTSTFALLTMTEPLTVWITTNCGKFFKRWEYQTNWPSSWEICMQVKKKVRTGNGTKDRFQIGKGVCQGCILSPCLFNLYAEYILRNARLDEA